MTKQQEQIKKRFENSRFFDSDPRPPQGSKDERVYLDAWKHTHDWFVYKRWDEHNTMLWVDVGYGFYALQDGGNVIGFGKDMIQTRKWVLLGEFYGNITLARIVI